MGQLNLSAANGCGCDGSVSFSWSSGESITAELTDFGNQFTQSDVSAAGIIQFDNLCPRVYSLFVSGLASGDTTLLFNIEDSTNPLPILSNEIVCYSEAGQDAVIELGDIAGVLGSSFQWAVPGNYQAINGEIDVNDMSSGVFLYTDVSSACSRSSAIVIDYYNNSAGNQTGSLLICESEVDSIELITLLGGNPAPGGYWTFQGQEFNGVFYPATMDGGFSNRYYYNVYLPECGITNIAPATVIERVPPNPGFSLTNQNWYCQTHSPVNMFELLGGDPQRGGDWTYTSTSPNAMVSGIDSVFTPGQSPSGVYEYRLMPLLPCVGVYKSVLTISYYPDPSPGVDLDTAVCISSDTLFLKEIIGAPEGFPGVFSDDSGAEVDSIYVPSMVSQLDVTYSINPFNCGVKSAFIHIETFQDVYAGDDVVLNLCQTELPIPVNSILSGTADSGGAWHGSAGSAFVGDITENLTGLELNYIVGNSGCGSDTSAYQVTVDQPLNFVPGVTEITVCSEGNPINLLSALGSSDLFFTNASNDILPTVLIPDSMESSIILAHLNSDNSCPNIEFPVTIEVVANEITNAFSQYHFCVSDLPIPLSDLIDPALMNLGSWTDEQSNMVSLADVQSNDSATYTFQLFNTPLCGSDIIEVKLYAEPLMEGFSNTNTTICLSEGVFNLSTLVDDDNSGVWYQNNLPLGTTILSLGNVINQQYEYRILSENSCPDAVSSHQFEVRALPAVNAGEDVNLCIGDTAVIGSQSLPGYSYNWFPGDFLGSSSMSTTMFISSPNSDLMSYTYSLSANDGFCSNTDSLVITLRNLPTISLEDSVTICNGEMITIDPSSDGTIVWQPAQGIADHTASSQSIWVNSDQILRLTASNNWGCSRSDSIFLNVVYPPVFSVNVDPISSCSPLSVFERIDSCNMTDATFRWIISGYDTLFGAYVNTTLRRPGLFDLILEAYSPEGCMSDTILPSLYEVFPNPIAQFEGYQEDASNLRQEIIFTNESENATNFEWSINGVNVSQMVHLSHDFDGYAPGSYQVCLLSRSPEGCADSICHDIQLIVEQVVYAPTAFTPNGDGTNDGFKPVINGFSPEVYELIIADQWGSIIFKSNNPDEYWMGEVRDGEYYCQNGIYNWMLTAKKFDNATVEIYRGSVMMIR